LSEVNWSSLHKTLGDNTRKSILELLKENDALTYTEIMAILNITNTGRLNYHLKALNGLISKDDQGKYHLTEKGQLAVNLLVTFPQRVRAEEKEQMEKAVTATLILVMGVFLIIASFSAYTSFFPTIVPGTFSRVIPQNTSIFLTDLFLANNGYQFTFHMGSSNSVYLYVLNSTQYTTLEQQYNPNHFLTNFTGTPPSYIDKFELKDNSVSLTLPQGDYYLYVYSNTSIVLNSLSLTQQTHQSVSHYLIVAVLAALGVLMIVLSILIFAHRIWP
jgi:predicted transcriptional regulator